MIVSVARFPLLKSLIKFVRRSKVVCPCSTQAYRVRKDLLTMEDPNLETADKKPRRLSMEQAKDIEDEYDRIVNGSLTSDKNRTLAAP